MQAEDGYGETFFYNPLSGDCQYTAPPLIEASAA